MKLSLLFSALFVVLILSFNFKGNNDDPVDALSQFPSGTITESDLLIPNDSCAVLNPEAHDDATHENGYLQVGDSSRWVQKMSPTVHPWTYTKICVGFTKTGATTSLTYDVVVYDSTATGPGNLLAIYPGETITGIPQFPGMIWSSTVVSIPVATGARYIGIRYDNNPSLAIYISVDQSAATPQWPIYNATANPPVWTIFTSAKAICVRAEGQPATNPLFPDYLYYKFENNPSSTTTPNCATPGVGNNPVTIGAPLALGSGGEFDSCLVGSGGTGVITTGWNCNLAAGSWTISFWVKDLIDLNPTYLFGDPGSTSFRCFYGGAALPNNILFRGPFTDILIPCPMPGTQVFHFVHDSVSHNILIYRNGVLLSTNPRTVNMPTGTGFRVGGYNTSSSMSGRMDEFRLYRRALSAGEVAASWNSDLGGCGIVGISQNNNQVPSTFSLNQNYPNPFNPTTTIKFGLPKGSDVKLVIYDLLGRQVDVLVDGFRQAGNYSVDFNASNLASGVYLYKLETDGFVNTKKMLLIK